MATRDQNDFPLPDGSDGNRRSAFHLPKYFRTEVNNKFLASTFDQLMQPGVVEKINGYFGRKQSAAYRPGDFYVGDVSKQREDYQLEPAVVIKDSIDNVSLYRDYNDYINQINNIGGDTSDHSLLNRQEYYAWDPHIDWDKFVNFREYYWLPNGPDPVSVAGQSFDVQSAFSVTSQDNGDNFAFVFSPDGLTQNPEIALYRGVAYRFEIDSPDIPISFRTQRLTARAWTPFTYYTTGETVLVDSKIYTAVLDHRSGDEFEEDEEKWNKNPNINLSQTIPVQGIEQGIVEFTLDQNTPDFLYYVSDIDINAGGLVKVYDLDEAAFIDVDKEIIGKTSYRTGQGFDLSNGMKIAFRGRTFPEFYQEGYYYVEGVGEAITLTPESELITPTDFLENEIIEFDTEGYDVTPYSTAIGFAREKDYFTINRSSRDGNLWSKYNRWFHREIIENAASVNNTELVIDQSQRATRPIIEFEAGLNLFNFGTETKDSVNLVDDFTADVFSTIEGSSGYSVDGVQLTQGMRVLFNNDPDIFVKGKIFEVDFISFKGERQIALRETDDAVPLTNQTVLCKQGRTYRGKTLHFNGEEWILSQEKIDVNQPPLFDVYNCDGDSLSDKEVYPSSDFAGTKVFSYSMGKTPKDTELGISLDYRNIQNIGDILFRFDLQADSVTYCPENSPIIDEATGLGFLRKYTSREGFELYNGWRKGYELSTQQVVRQFEVKQESNFPIDVYNESALLDDISIKVFVNNRLQFEAEDYQITTVSNNQLEVQFFAELQTDDIILIKTKSSAPKNENGVYEIASNLERNPKNENLELITLGEINDHVQTIVENLDEFQGTYPGTSNLRDTGLVAKFGKRIIRHSAPLSLALYHLDNNAANIIHALRYSKNEYAKFKRDFVEISTELGFEGPINQHFEAVMRQYRKNKSAEGPFFATDMFAIGAALVSNSEVSFENEVFFALSQDFTLEELSNRSVLVYKNGEQLLHGYDYTFNEEGFVELLESPNIRDIITIYEFESTNGCYVPATPTKLGLYPLYKPQKYLDDTYLEPREVIQGHDGSIVAAYGDFRDNLILELEKRIYNNIKIDYDPEVFDIHDYIPSRFRNTGLTKHQIDQSLLPDFIGWTNQINADFTDNNFYERTNSFTYNYSGTANINDEVLNGWWRNIYKEIFDTDRPHTHPWEMLGFSEKPEWWNEQYGPAPYTRNNLLLWEDLAGGILRKPGEGIKILDKYIRPKLNAFIPVDETGKLIPPLKTNYVTQYNSYQLDGRFVFGDHAPVETAWRRSAEYPFALISSLVQNQPNRVFATAFDRSRIFRSPVGELSYKYSNVQFRLRDIEFPNRQTDEEIVYTSGLVNYIRDYVDSNSAYETYKNDLRRIEIQIGFKLAGFSNKEKFKLLLDSRTPLNEGNVFVPEENYKIFLNTSSPTRNIFYSGVFVEKIPSGFVIRGYDEYQPYFEYYEPIRKQSDSTINIGGITEPTITWSERQFISKGTVVQFRSRFYRAIESHTSTFAFESEKFIVLPDIPREGGRDIILRSSFDRIESVKLDYGTVVESIQDVIDFLLGYGDWLEDQGFVFDHYDQDSLAVSNWKTSAKEFTFWTLQNWSSGAVISLSPGAFELKFRREFAMVDNIYDTFYGYSLFKVDGKPLNPEYVSLSRESENEFKIRSKNTEDGIFGVRLSLVQKEHAVIIDNRTDFGDILYDQVPGYRQERIKTLGYRTTNWNGSLNIPGFIFDDARVEEWERWKDYSIGDLVRYKEFFYSAKNKIAGTEVFEADNWQLLDGRPEPELLPNFDYRASQFADFYDLDSDNFDAEQQRFAQHLIGYQNRDYLANIINDDVSQYKFYQGFIQDKGTTNALTKLFDPLGSQNRESLDFYEEWAIKAGQYGAVQGFEEVEFLIDELKIKTDPQSFELVNSIDSEYTGRVVKILPSETYLKPDNYDHSIPIPVSITDSFVENSGYVTRQEVSFIVDRYQDILDIAADSLELSSKIWVGNLDESWQVYTLIETDLVVELIEKIDESFALELSSSVFDIKVDDIICLFFTTNDANYRVVDIESNRIIVAGPDNLEIEENYAKIFQYVPSRFESVNKINDAIYLIEDGVENFYIDQDLNNRWKVLERDSSLVAKQEMQNPNSVLNSFGSSFAVNDRNTVLAVGSPGDGNGKVFVYTRPSASGNYRLAQTLTLQDFITDENPKFGAAVSVSDDGEFIFVGSPEASNVVSQYQGKFDEDRGYSQGDVVQFRDNLWKATTDIQKFLDSVPLGSWNSYLQNLIEKDLIGQDDETIEVLLAGNYPLLSIGNRAKAATTENLNASYADGVLTANVDGVFTVDGVSEWRLGESVIVKDQDDKTINGLYLIADIGSIFNPWKLERASIMNESSEVPNLFVLVKQGNTNFNTGWIFSVDNQNSFVLDEDNIEVLSSLGEGQLNDADHFLLRAPRDMFQGSSIGDEITVKWNTKSYGYQNQELGNTQPFDGDIRGFDNSTLTGTLTIADKIDSILSVPDATAIPEVGQLIETPEAVGTIAYIYNLASSLSIYIKDQNGEYPREGTAITEIGEFIGRFERIEPVEITADFTDTFGGFWKIDVGENYIVDGKNSDAARGLVIHDVIPSGDTDQNRFFYNILDFEPPTNTGPDDRYSEITTLSYSGLPGPYEQQNFQLESNLFVIRAPKPLTDGLQVGDEVDVFYNFLPNYEQGLIKDISQTGLSAEDINKTQTVEYVWDGFIDLEIQNFEAGRPVEPYDIFSEFVQVDPVTEQPIPLVIRDREEGGTAEVVFYQKFNADDIRIYIQNIQGDFGRGRLSGEPRTIEFLADGSGDSFYDPDKGFRRIGQSVTRSFPNASENIGKLLVFQRQIPVRLSSVTDSILLEAEYWFYYEETVLGSSRPANLPSTFNVDWEKTFATEASAGGDPSGLEKEGLLSIFRRTGKIEWSTFGNYIVPDRKDNNRFGSDLRFANMNGLYKLLVKAEEEKTLQSQSYGKIYTFKNGSENGLEYNWDIGIDKNYAGEYIENASTNDVIYTDGNIVYHDNKLYQALTNVSAKPFEKSEWQELESPIDYLGYVPNDSDLTLDSLSGQIDFNGLEIFADAFDLSKNGEIIVISTKYIDRNSVQIYRNVDGVYVKTQTLAEFDTDEQFGYDVAVNSTGRFIAISAPLNSNNLSDQGKVYLYKQVSGEFLLTQELVGPTRDIGEQFGTEIAFDKDLLAVTSKNSSSVIKTTFDQGRTTFDQKFTNFLDNEQNTGVVRLYQIVDNNALYFQSIDYDNKTKFFGKTLEVKNDKVYTALPRYNLDANSGGILLEFAKQSSGEFWSTKKQLKDTIDINKIKQILLYDTDTEELIQYLDYIDPLQGKIAGVADQEIDFKMYNDPATYNTGTAAKINKTNSWGKKQVGKVWWDLSNARFRNPYQESVTYSANNWNKLFSNKNSIDVYEWVESDLTPNEWDEISGSERGFTRGITGTTRYGNNAYVIKRVYDEINDTINEKYYYWVRDKSTIPVQESRSTSSRDIARLIEDPFGQGYPFISLISPNAFALYNCNSIAKNRSVALNIQYYTIDNQDANVHREYKILTENLESSIPDETLERKWFDSLVGFDHARRPVPDTSLNIKQKYGTLDNPRQGWFINRIEALKQVIERINRILIDNLIIDEKNISRLTEQDMPPLESINYYDTTVESEIDLDIIGVARSRRARLKPIIDAGQIVEVNILDAGRSYRRPPTVEILGTGTGAQITTEIDSQGRVINAIIDNSGEYYSQNTSIVVRPFAVLVESDSTIAGKWAIYQRNNLNNQWIRQASQAFDVQRYWEYKDWYSEGYNRNTDINFLIDESYELFALNDRIGDVVKIRSINSGGWLLLEKIDNQKTVDYTINYKTIGRQNGTIQFLPRLYSTEENLAGYDLTNFDSVNFDALPITETRIILETVRDNIFINELAVEYNRLFFASLRYVFAEQNNVDWAFKTSFVKAQHNVGELKQKLTFSNDNLPSYEKYVREIKPYKTKIREYLSNYENRENSASVITDFDLPPRFVETEKKIKPFKTSIRDNALVTTAQDIDNDPYKNWKDSFTSEIIKIDVVNSGKGYTTAPIVQITGGGGKGATASCSLGPNGTVSQIVVTDPGHGYTSSPSISILGSLSENGTEARAVAKIGNSRVRSTSMKIKFDRLSGSFEFVNLNTIEEFKGSGFKQEFHLKWPLDLRSNQISVFINNNPVPRGRFSYENRLDTSLNYDRFLGKIFFEAAPAAGATIRIEYKKDIDILSAADRINFEYNPKEGQLGNYIGQLMEGVDYGGVEITGFDFSGQTGWDSQGWFAQPWDVFDTEFEDEIIELDGSTISVELSQPLESNVVYNIYRVARDINSRIVSNTRMDDPNFGTAEQTNANAVCESIIGDGSTTIVELDELNIPTTADNSEDRITLIIRKITSDGSFIPDPDSYDTSIVGGDLNYANAKGISSEEIEIDGAGFVTPTTSKGPEEIVPGQLVDTVDIRVYESPVGGGSPIELRNYVADGTQTVFYIGNIPVNETGVFVKIDYSLQDNTDYIIDYVNGSVIFSQAPQENSVVNIVNLGNSASNITSIEEFSGDGSTGEFLLPVRYNDEIEIFATVDGKEKGFIVFESDDSYEIAGSTVVKFATPPANQSAINLLISTKGIEASNISTVRVDEFIADGSSTQFTLENDIFSQQPAVNNVLAFVNNSLLSSVYNKQFVIEENKLSYQLDVAQIPSDTTDPRYIEVYLNGNLLSYLSDYTFDPSDIPGVVKGNQINLSQGLAEPGDILDVYVMNTGDYRFGFIDETGEFVRQRGEDSTLPVLNLDSTYNAGDKIKVYSFLNHDTQKIERQSVTVNYNPNIIEGTPQYFDNQKLNKGVIDLRTSAVNSSAVWVVKNGNLLNGNIDYTVINSNKTVKLSGIPQNGDEIEIIHFSATPITEAFGWRQFKDILNRTHYKRLGKSYAIVQDFRWFDKEIIVENADDLPEPKYNAKQPGIIFIEGERIEYFVKQDNVLTQLRRGTLGTGVKELYKSGTIFVEQGSSNNLPYQDSNQTITVDSGGYRQGTVEYENSIGMSIDDIQYDFNNNSAFPLGGQVATVTGSGFRENVVVFVGETECDTTYIDTSTLQFITPESPVGSYDLIVVNPATTEPLNISRTSVVSPGLVKYLQVLLPFEPQPNPDSEEGWYKETEEISVTELQIGRGYVINTVGDTDFVSLGAPDNRVGTEFIATRAGAGAGTVINYTSIPYEYWEAQDIEVFVGGRRLRKAPYTVYNYEALDSPEGDKTQEAEYAVNKNIGAYVRLTEAPPPGVKVTIVRKTGTLWSDSGTPLAQSDSQVARFLLAQTTELPR